MRDIIDYLLVTMGFKKSLDPSKLEIARENFKNNLVFQHEAEEIFEPKKEDTELTLMLRQAIVREVESRIENASSFTAFDITNAVRQAGFTAYHSEVKEVVHGLWEQELMVGYDRELRDMGGPIEAWMYFPQSRPAHILPLRIPALQGTPWMPTDSVDADAPEVRTADGRNTICVPSTLTRQIEVNPGDKVYVLADRDNSKLVLTREIPDVNDMVVVPYTVDRSNNVRITEGTQVAAGLFTNRFALCVENDAVILRAA